VSWCPVAAAADGLYEAGGGRVAVRLAGKDDLLNLRGDGRVALDGAGHTGLLLHALLLLFRALLLLTHCTQKANTVDIKTTEFPRE